MSEAMVEDYYLLEAANWAAYYDYAYKQINEIRETGIADMPPQDIIDDPSAFKAWVKQCHDSYVSRFNRST